MMTSNLTFGLIGALLGAFLIGILILPQVIRLVKKHQLMDQPNWRSAHTEPTPSMGGVSFTIPMLIGVWFLPFDPAIVVLVLSAVGLSAMGLVDDLKDLSSSRKFLGQILVATVLYMVGFKLDNLHGLFGIEELPGIVSYGLTIFLITGIINAFNLIDGIDGLASGLGLINSSVFGLIFVLQGEVGLAVIALLFSGSLAAFLRFNFNPAKIFMGDTGSLVLGVLMAAFFLKTYSFGHVEWSATALAMMLVPCIDMVRLFASRIKKGVSPFKADKNHYHHLLIKTGDSHKIAAITCYVMGASLIAGGWFLGTIMSMTLTIFSVIVIGISIYAVVEMKFYFKHKKDRLKIQKDIDSVVEDNPLLNELIV